MCPQRPRRRPPSPTPRRRRGGGVPPRAFIRGVVASTERRIDIGGRPEGGAAATPWPVQAERPPLHSRWRRLRQLGDDRPPAACRRRRSEDAPFLLQCALRTPPGRGGGPRCRSSRSLSPWPSSPASPPPRRRLRTLRTTTSR